MSANTADTPDFITVSSYPQAILHVDCDAFFASCEEARDPRLKGKPIVTGKERGIIACASYAAKACGIKRGVRLGDARRLCPGLIVLPSDYETYSIYSERLFAILRRFTPQVEEFSIDEAFCDITGLRRLYRSSYADIARKIKDAVQAELDITVSVGLSLTKTLAKICSKHRKPNGFTALPGRKLHEFLATVPLERVCGFGPSTVALLTKCGIGTPLDYVRRPESFARKLIGKTGVELWQELRGVSVYPVSLEKKEKYLTISKTKTFMPPSGDRDLVKGQLVRNLESACIKLRRHGLSARNLVVYLRRSDFSAVGCEARITRHSASTLDFTRVCAGLFADLFQSGAAYRATGVVLGDIRAEGFDSRDLFDDPVKIEKTRRLGHLIDDINQLYGKHTIHVASSSCVSKKDPHARNDVASRKKELLKGETFRKRLSIPLVKFR